MDESFHPFYFSCPTGYLKLVPIDKFGGCKEWRDDVREYHAERKAKRLAKAS